MDQYFVIVNSSTNQQQVYQNEYIARENAKKINDKAGKPIVSLIKVETTVTALEV